MKHVHAHSVEAYHEGAELFGKRHQQVIEALGKSPSPLTDREIMVACGFSDPNAVRPRVTELVEAGVLQEAGCTQCPVTGRKVRRVAIVRHEAQAVFDLGEVLTPDVVQAVKARSA